LNFGPKTGVEKPVENVYNSLNRVFASGLCPHILEIIGDPFQGETAFLSEKFPKNLPKSTMQLTIYGVFRVVLSLSVAEAYIFSFNITIRILSTAFVCIRRCRPQTAA